MGVYLDHAATAPLSDGMKAILFLFWMTGAIPVLCIQSVRNQKSSFLMPEKKCINSYMRNQTWEI